MTKKYYDQYGNLAATLDFDGYGASGAFDASNRLKAVSGTIGTRVNVTGTLGDTGGVGEVWVTPNDDITKRIQAEVTDGLWIARNVELLDSNDNEIVAMGYDDAGNTATDSVDTVSLDANVSITYSYDSKGNMIEKGNGTDTTTLEYYQNGLLKMVALANGDSEVYHYDAAGRRYMIVSYNGSYDTKTFAFSGSSIIKEIEDGDTVIYEYILSPGLGGGIGSILYQITADDTYTYYTYNHKGDVSALLDEAEDIVALYEYDAFGNILTSAIDDNSTNTFTFSTREFSELSGLGHWPVREYDPFVGRWTRLDPAGDVDGMNLYVYVKNNPVLFIDIQGHFSIPYPRFIIDVFKDIGLQRYRLYSYSKNRVFHGFYKRTHS